MKELKHLSASSLALHKRNPRRWCLQYLEGIQDPPSSALVVGKAVHYSIENYLRHGYWTYDTELINHASYRNIRKGVEFLIGTESNSPGKYKHWHVEEDFLMYISGALLPIKGVIDMWRDGEGVISIYDHKTCNPRYKETPSSLLKNWQINIYAHYLSDMLRNEENKVLVGHNQFIKDRKNNIIGCEYINTVLTKQNTFDIIEEVRAECLAALNTVEIYRAGGLKEVRATPENKYWYGQLDPLWSIINGETIYEKSE